MNRNITIGSRASVLALRQTEIIRSAITEHFPDISVEVKTFTTTGDRILDRTLDQVGGKGLFVKELDRALAEGEIDIAVHSLKDMPMEQPDGFPIRAFFRRGDCRYALVLAAGAEMHGQMHIGSSSARRQIQLRALFPQAHMESVRGNLQRRLEKLDHGEFDALVLAAAGLERLGLSGRICRYFSPEELLPAAGQGVIAVQGGADLDSALFAAINDPQTELSARAERAFVRALDGGCSSPVAAYAEIAGNACRVRGRLPDADGVLRTFEKTGMISDAERIGEMLAKEARQYV